MSQEQEFEKYLGGAPKEAVQEFLKPGELSEDDLDFGMAGYKDTATAADYQFNQLQHQDDVFREKAVEDEKARMLAELEQSQKADSQENTHTM